MTACISCKNAYTPLACHLWLRTNGILFNCFVKMGPAAGLPMVKDMQQLASACTTSAAANLMQARSHAGQKSACALIAILMCHELFTSAKSLSSLQKCLTLRRSSNIKASCLCKGDRMGERDFESSMISSATSK